MREIKFKAKRKDNKEWIKGYVFDDGIIGSKRKFIGGLVIQDYNGTAYDDYVVDTNFYEINPDTLSQYTGLKDKNGTEIYEHDKVWNNYFKKYGIIEWDKKFAMFVVSFGDQTVYITPSELSVVGTKFDEVEEKENE